MLAAILSQLKVLSVVVAALGGWVFGALWYWALGRQWANALKQPAGAINRPAASAIVISLVAELIMATMLFGIVFHIGEVSVERALFSAVMVWIGFVATTVTVNNRFARDSWARTLIDAGHWLGVLLVMGAIIGTFGA
jgi:Protein of unknown function (DUF1761)